MQRVGYREVKEMGEGAGHHVLWEGKYITQGCAASAPARFLGGRNHAIFETSFAHNVVRHFGWHSGALSWLRGANRVAWEAPPRRFRWRLEQGERSEFSRRQQQGHARRAPEKRKEGCRETLRPRGPA